MDALQKNKTDENDWAADMLYPTVAESKDTLLKDLNHETSLESNASEMGYLGVHVRTSEDTSGNATSPEFLVNLVLDSPNLKKAESTIAIKEYVHEELLGEGNTHRVYKSSQDGRPVALKIKMKNHERQNKEWEVFAFLKEEYIIGYYCKDEGFLVTELCEGSIYKMVDNRKEINISNRMILGKELIVIIQELHHRNIVHASLTEHKICLTMPEAIGGYHIRLLGSSKSYISADTMCKEEDIINAGKMVGMIIRWCSLDSELVHEDLPLWNDLVTKMVNAEYKQIDEVFSHPLLINLKDRRKLFQLGLSRESQTDDCEYHSRFVKDYDEILILGRGGFGIVFKAKNKLDGCYYAIKRICLRKEDAQDINREVEALATLNHDNIVRYHIAWIECPPCAWQKQKDKTWPKVLNLSEEDENFAEDENFENLPDIQRKLFAESLSGTSQNVSESSKMNVNAAINELEYSKEFSWADSEEDENFAEDENFENLPDIQRKLFAESLSGTSQNVSESSKMNVNAAINELEYSKEFSWAERKLDSKDSGTDYEESSKNYLPSLSTLDVTNDNEVFEDSNYNNSIDFKDVWNNSDDSNNVNASKNFPDFNEINKPDNLNNDCKQEEEKLFLYIQMEFCEKRTLKEWLIENIKNRDIPDALAKFEQITSAVQYIHGNEFMHRDLKPANIFLSNDDKIKIGDFGLTKALTPLLDTAGCDKQGQIHSANIGTKLYMSPELKQRDYSGKVQKQGNYSEKVDIYALGVILFELIYPMATDSERCKTLESIQPVANKDVKEGIFPKTDDERLQKMFEYVSHLLSFDPKQRPSAKDILESVAFLKIDWKV